MKSKRLLILLLIITPLLLVASWQFFYKQRSKEIIQKNISFNQVVDSKTNETSSDYYESKYKNEEIVWNGKISGYYSQITGIKFCIVDEDHKEVDINKPCDWFWAFSEKLIDADDTKINPNWDGLWVNYILNYYKVPFDKNTSFYNDIYTITGTINGVDCGINNKCHPDIEIINIKIN